MVRKELNKIPGVLRAVVQDLSLSGFSAQRGFPVEFNVRGPDWDKLADLSAQMMKKMKTRASWWTWTRIISWGCPRCGWCRTATRRRRAA